MGSTGKRRRRVLGLVVAGVVFGVCGQAFAAPIPATLVKQSKPPFLMSGVAASDSFFAWSQNAVKSGPSVVFVQPMVSNLPHGSAVRASLPGAGAIPGGIAGDRLAYDQFVAHRAGEIRFFNLSTHQHANPPLGVNTPQDEEDATLTDTWLLFDRRGGGSRRVLLFNLQTHSVRVLATAKGGNEAIATQVNGNFATYTVCTVNACTVHLYNITTRANQTIPQPAGQSGGGAAVSSTGTLYWSQEAANSVCGNSVQIMTRPLGGPTTALGTLPAHDDVFSLQTYNDGSHDQLFYPRLSCTTGRVDIYRSTAP